MFKKPNTACYLGAQTILVAILEGSWQHWVSHWDTGEMGRGTKTIVIQIIIIIIINVNTELVIHAMHVLLRPNDHQKTVNTNDYTIGCMSTYCWRQWKQQPGRSEVRKSENFQVLNCIHGAQWRSRRQLFIDQSVTMDGCYPHPTPNPPTPPPSKQLGFTIVWWKLYYQYMPSYGVRSVCCM